MPIIPQRPLPEGHPDLPKIQAISDAIEKRAKGWETFAVELPIRLRQALDEVIDTPRTGRFVLEQTEKTEKTYVGTKVEILVRDYLDFPKGILDLEVDGSPVDVKNTVTGNWMIPSEALGHACLLIHENENDSVCSFGIIVARPEYLTKGGNRDGKVSVSKLGRKHIHWILYNHPYPQNFWLRLTLKQRRWIIEPKGGNRRLERLFLMFLGVPIDRRIAESIARQKDFMKRLRGNGGIRDILGPRGIALMSGTYDNELLVELNMAPIKSDQFVSVAIGSRLSLGILQKSNRHRYVTALWRSENLQEIPEESRD